MALKNDFFADTLYASLSLEVSASEEEIQKAYNSIKAHVDRGFMVTEEDKAKSFQLESKLFDPEFRLRSMILKGDFGSKALDNQLDRLKQLLSTKKMLAQEWIELASSLHGILRSSAFSQLLLILCPLTKNVKSGAQNILTKAVDSVFQMLVDFQVSGVENACKNSDKNTALEHLEVVKNFPEIPSSVRQKALEIIFEHFWKLTQSKIVEIKSIQSSIDHVKSEYDIKAIASRMEQEAKDGLLPLYRLFLANAFQNQKKYLSEIHLALNFVIQSLQASHKPDKADFFIAQLNEQQVPVEQKSSQLTSTSKLKIAKLSDSQVLKTAPSKTLAAEKKQSTSIFKSFLFFIGISSVLVALLLLTPTAQKKAEKYYAAMPPASSPEARFLQNLKFLSQTPFHGTDLYLQVLQTTTEFIIARLNIYASEGKIPDFMNRMNAILKILDKQVKLDILQKIEPSMERYFNEHQFGHADFFLWWLKTGTYGMAQNILSKRIDQALKNENLQEVQQSIAIAKTHLVPLPEYLIKILLNKKIISKEISLLLATHFSDIHEKIWSDVILELWELRSPLSDEEGLLILEKVGSQCPDLHVDLLQMILNKNERNQIPWPEKLEIFQNPSVEKRVKLLACQYFVKQHKNEAALKLFKTLPEHPENNALMAMRLPIFFIQKQYFRVRHISEELFSTQEEFYDLLRGLAYTRTGDPKKAVAILDPWITLRFQEHLDLWKKLHTRETIVRKGISEKLDKQKICPIHQRIENDRELARDKEKFLLSELTKDFQITKIKTQIANHRYYQESIFGWIESSLQLKDPVLLRTVELRLREMRDAFLDPKIKIYQGEVFSLLGQHSNAEKIFQEVEQSCLALHHYSPLLTLCAVYERLSLHSSLKELTQILLEQCKDPEVCDALYRFLAERASGGDPITFLNKIVKKNVTDEIQLSLFQIQQEKTISSKAPLRSLLVGQLEALLQNSERFFNTDNISLLEALGDQSFLFYRLTHSRDALNKATRFFKQALLFSKKNTPLDIKILHTLWFRILENIFATEDISLLSEDCTLPYWHALALKSESKQGSSVVHALNTHPHFSEVQVLVEKILSTKTLWVTPPIFFELLCTDGVPDKILGGSPDLSEIKKISFSKFWAEDSVTEALLNHKRHTLISLQEGSSQSANDLRQESETALYDWIYKNRPIKGNFEALIERVELNKGLIKPTFVARKLLLDIKLARMALWFDPDREWIGSIPVPWVIAKFVREGQTARNSELQLLWEEAQQIQKEVAPFFLEDLYGLQTNDPNFFKNGNPKIQKLIHYAVVLDPNSKKNQVGMQLFKKRVEEVVKNRQL
jgi:hypothetical protein